MGMGMGMGVTRRLSDLRNDVERRICTIGGWWWVIRGLMRLATWPKWRDATSRFAGTEVYVSHSLFCIYVPLAIMEFI